MPSEYQVLQHSFTTKWTGSNVEYTFLDFLPDYYVDGSGYAASHDDEVHANQGFESFRPKQQQAIYYLLEDSSSSKINGNYANSVDYRVSFSDILNFSFNEKIKTRMMYCEMTAKKETL